MSRDEAPDPDAWTAWSPTELGTRLNGIGKPWYIVGGWALDLWHGRQTRDHDDIEFAVLREDVSAFRQILRGMRFYTANAGRLKFLPDGEEPGIHISQVWCQDKDESRWRVDMMIEPGTPSTWTYKRNAEITRARADTILTSRDGLPYLTPAAVLLFKSKHQRPKDEIDFNNAFPDLSPSERNWLRACLENTDPAHAWLSLL